MAEDPREPPPAGTGRDSSGNVVRSGLERFLLALVRLLVKVYFYEVEVVGEENVPRDRGGLLVAWHPNGLVDPCLLVTKLPGRVVFGAKHSLFSWPLLGPVMVAFNAAPIYRSTDSQTLSEDERRAANEQSLAALAKRVVAGDYAALFPEGVSHDEPRLAPLKQGAARLYYEARAILPPGSPAPAIVPVGLHYDEKHLFRSSALVWFHEPLVLPPELDRAPDPGEDEAAARSRARALTALIEDALTRAVHPAEDWPTHRLIHRTRKLVRAERAKRAGLPSVKPTLEEKVLGFARVQRAYYERLRTHPEEARRLRQRVERYDENLNALGLDDHELAGSQPIEGGRLLLMTALQFGFVFLLLPPLLVVGFAVNAPPALAVFAIVRAFAKTSSEIATIKLVAGIVLFPLTWIAVVPVGMLAHEWIGAGFPSLPDTPLVTGLVLAAAAIVGGAHALGYQRLARQAWKNLRIRFRRRMKRVVIVETLALRAGIFDDIMAIAEGLDLPGSVLPDGSIGE